jgi:vancomycin aglycone glucosyltransferase
VPVKFVFAAYGSRGDTEPCVAVAGELRRRGHDVRMALTVAEDMRAYVESAGLVTVPYGRDWQDLLDDEDFTRMLENPMAAIPQAVEYVSQVVAEKSATLVSLAEDADLIVAGMTEQTPAGNVAEYYRIPLAALHFFPAQLLQQQGPSDGAATTQSDRAQRAALGLPEQPPAGGPALEIQA